MTKLFDETFNNPDHMKFIRQTYFNCLSPNEKLQYVESQSFYATKHRTYLLHGLINIDIYTKHKDNNNQQLSIGKWLQTIKDNDNKKLFIDINLPINNSVEVTILSTNFDIVQQWEKNCIANIAREISPANYKYAFATTTDINLLLSTTEPWTLPEPQKVNFLVTQRPAWNIESNKPTNKPPAKPPNPDIVKKTTTTIQPPKQIMTNTDNQTNTTITLTSEDNETIEDLQNNIKEHEIKISIQDTRIASLEQHYQDLLHLDELSDRIIALELGYRDHKTDISKIHVELAGLTKTTSLISSTIQKQLQQIQNQRQAANDIIETNNTRFQSFTKEHQSFQSTLVSHKNNIQNLHEQADKTATKHKALKTKFKQQQEQIDDIYSNLLPHQLQHNQTVHESPKRKQRKPKESPNTSTTQATDPAPSYDHTMHQHYHDYEYPNYKDDSSTTNNAHNTNHPIITNTQHTSNEEDYKTNSESTIINNSRTIHADNMNEQLSQCSEINKTYDSDESLAMPDRKNKEDEDLEPSPGKHT
jgi:hypothetical protein